MSWRARPGRLIIRQLSPDESLIYQVDSADTHLVHPFVAKVLETLMDEPLTISAIRDHVDADHSDELSNDLQDIMLSLQDLSLIELINP